MIDRSKPKMPLLTFALCAGLLGCAAKAAPRHAESYAVQGHTVSIHKQGPVRFDTAVAMVGPALPLPQVTARVTTPESHTSPNFAPLSGRVVETRVHLGDRVKKGDKMVLVRSAEFPDLTHDLHAAELAVATRASSVERLKQLVAARVGAEHDLMLAESQLAEAKLAVTQGRARLASLQVDRNDDNSYWLLAGRDGTIVQLDATAGLQVGPERVQPVATVADLSELMVIADVPQHDAVELKPGTPAEVFASESSEPVNGIVQVVSEVVDPERQTVPVRIAVPNQAHLLRPNAYVDVSFGSAGAGERVLVPAAAVVRDGARAVVFVETEKGTFKRREIVVGREQYDRAEVLSGLKAGEHVVTTGALLLLNAIDLKA